MAKRKVKSKPRKRATSMIKRRKPRRKRRTTTTTRSTLSSKPRVRRRRRRKGLLSSNGTMTVTAKHTGAGAVGGGLFLATRMFNMPLWVRGLIGYGGSVALAMMNSPFVGAGMAGATTYFLGQTLLPSTLLKDDLEETDYVDSDTLEDTGYIDEYGNSIVMDDDQVMYALNDDDELEAIGDAYDLADMQNVSMIPLQDDPYALASY